MLASEKNGAVRLAPLLMPCPLFGFTPLHIPSLYAYKFVMHGVAGPWVQAGSDASEREGWEAAQAARAWTVRTYDMTYCMPALLGTIPLAPRLPNRFKNHGMQNQKRTRSSPSQTTCSLVASLFGGACGGALLTCAVVRGFRVRLPFAKTASNLKRALS